MLLMITQILIIFDNSNKISQFLERHKLPKLIPKDIENLNNPVKHQFIILNFPAKKTPNSNGFTAEFSH